MEKRKNRVYGAETYVDGNTVRRMEAAPDYHRERQEKKKQEERMRKQRVASRNQEKVAHMNRGYVAFLAFATALIAGAAAMYVNLQSSINVHLKTISALESQVSDLRADNDATEKRIEASVDITEIKDAAVNQLGMVYAGADQIVHYSIDQEDYMNQYEDIPEK
ncbi:MAG: hypothetical protein ACI4DO_01605 [Roseburia sp.]